MKKINFLFALLFVCTLISCDKDDDGSTGGVIPSELVGTWQLTERTSNGENIALAECQEGDQYVFNADATFKDIFSEPQFVNGETICSSFSENGKVTVEGNKIVFFYEGDEPDEADFYDYEIRNGDLILIYEFVSTGFIDPVTGEEIPSEAVREEDRYIKL